MKSVVEFSGGDRDQGPQATEGEAHPAWGWVEEQCVWSSQRKKMRAVGPGVGQDGGSTRPQPVSRRSIEPKTKRPASREKRKGVREKKREGKEDSISLLIGLVLVYGDPACRLQGHDLQRCIPPQPRDICSTLFCIIPLFHYSTTEYAIAPCSTEYT